MADIISTMPARASETAHFDLDPALLTAVPDAFERMLEALAALRRAEAEAAPCWACFPALAADWDETAAARDVVEVAVEDVLALEPASPADRNLRGGALLVWLTLDMDGPVDRDAVRQMIEAAERCLIMPEGRAGADGDAKRSNTLLHAAFAHLRQLNEIAEANAEAAHLTPLFGDPAPVSACA